MRDRFDFRSGILLPAVAFGIAVFTGVAVAADAGGQMALGRDVFTKLATPPCGLCHTLQDAGTNGEIGAKLEEIKPEAARVMEAVRKGLGVMPSYTGKLTEEQIQAVASYVEQAARSAK